MARKTSLAVVDDDRLCAFLAREAFSNDPDFDLRGVAHTAREAEALLPVERPDVVLIDWILGNDKGTDVIARLAPALAGTRWVVMSGFVCGDLIRDVDAVGAHGIIDKLNLVGRDLRAAISTAAAGNEYFLPSSSAIVHEALNPDSPYHLTERQRQVLSMVAAYHSRAEIAVALNISRPAVSKHLATIARKLAFDGAPALSVLIPAARSVGMLPPTPPAL